MVQWCCQTTEWEIWGQEKIQRPQSSLHFVKTLLCHFHSPPLFFSELWPFLCPGILLITTEKPSRNSPAVEMAESPTPTAHPRQGTGVLEGTQWFTLWPSTHVHMPNTENNRESWTFASYCSGEKFLIKKSDMTDLGLPSWWVADTRAKPMFFLHCLDTSVGSRIEPGT